MIPEQPKKEKGFWKFMKELLFQALPYIISRIKIKK
jgi:hypothetical protein